MDVLICIPVEKRSLVIVTHFLVFRKNQSNQYTYIVVININNQIFF